jgi:hypothetical protein
MSRAEIAVEREHVRALFEGLERAAAGRDAHDHVGRVAPNPRHDLGVDLAAVGRVACVVSRVEVHDRCAGQQAPFDVCGDLMRCLRHVRAVLLAGDHAGDSRVDDERRPAAHRPFTFSFTIRAGCPTT